MLWIVIGDFSLIDNDVVVVVEVLVALDCWFRSDTLFAADIVGSWGIFLMNILRGNAASFVKFMNVI